MLDAAGLHVNLELRYLRYCDMLLHSLSATTSFRDTCSGVLMIVITDAHWMALPGKQQ
jgi:hypothetical protein